MKVFFKSSQKYTMGLHVGISPKPLCKYLFTQLLNKLNGPLPEYESRAPCIQMDHAYRYISFINSIIHAHFVHITVHITVHMCSCTCSYLFVLVHMCVCVIYTCST